MYQVAIVEDEPRDEFILRQHLERYGDEREERFDVTLFETASEFVSCQRVFDLVFMDIQLPGISGIDAAELMRTYNETTAIIFVTDLAQYAVRGYEVDALDFMVKPVSYASFSLRMDRAMRVLRRNAGRRLVLNVKGGPIIVPASALVYVELVGHDLVYHLDDGTEPRARGSMRQAEEMRAEASFLRISSGQLVNMGHVVSVQGDALTMSNGARLYFSRARRKEAMEALACYLGDGA